MVDGSDLEIVFFSVSLEFVELFLVTFGLLFFSGLTDGVGDVRF